MYIHVTCSEPPSRRAVKAAGQGREHDVHDAQRRRAARVHVPPDGGAAEAADGGAEEEDE